MKPEQKQKFDDFVARLNGKTAGGKPPFKDFVSAAKSLPRLDLPDAARDELKELMGKKFGREEGAPSKPGKGKKTTAKTVTEATADAGLPKPVPVSRQPVYSTIPPEVAAKLEFLSQAIESNVAYMHGLKAAHDAYPPADTSEIQDAINRTAALLTQYNQEVDRILASCFGMPQNTPAPPARPAGFAPPTQAPQAPTPPTPPQAQATAALSRKPIGFRMPREQTAPDPTEVRMLEATRPKYLGNDGGFTAK